MSRVLFLDIETVPQTEYIDYSDEWLCRLWTKKVEKEGGDMETLWPRAGLYAEFGKIVCISYGYINNNAKVIQSLSGNEYHILKSLEKILNTPYFSGWRLCAHNGKGFDFPFIARRMIINNIVVPSVLNTLDKKPWEVSLLDTMELWKFGDFKYYASLDTLCYALGVQTPKDGIDGSMVYDVYYKEKAIERIIKYCEEDVRALIDVYHKIVG